jgi:HK97 family phage portal protein
MGVFDLFRRRAPETRSVVGSSVFASAGGRYPAIDPGLAESLSAVMAAINLIGSAIASLPVYIRKRDGDREKVDDAHPIAALIQRGPNAWQTWPDMVDWMMAQVLLSGNALLEIITDERGSVVELRPIPWGNVGVSLLPSGRLVYEVSATSGLFGVPAARRRLLDSEVVHLRDRSDNGLVGRSRLSRCFPTLKAAVQQQEFAGQLYENGVVPSGALKFKSKLHPDQVQQVRLSLDNGHAGSSRAFRALILQEGMEWQSLGVTPQDAELLESRKFSTEEIARIFNVPPPLLQDYSRNTFTNSASAGRWFAQFTLAPWLRKIEAEFARSLLSDAQRATHCIEFDMSAFLRGDDQTRWAAWKIGLDGGVLSPNDVRHEEGFNPRPGGEVYASPGARPAAAPSQVPPVV